ncbi:uncharacterized protein EDB91DRAFT_1255824 [Suillus paluster]|uniref:uncharacterized protein n=1 Tax=Suillus paluster TaxID=48578 RepID=UPI001B86255C|nr:uncharacterized protein EDB91DRAFT_1255824 [Suillus paluster]KAG1722961.1 hypothetical protein EDB91DRAFT_1255824 [Suillus paluster]
MARSGHSTQLTSRRHRTHQPQSQKLTENEISELKNYLPEWTSAKRSEKRGVFNAIARAAREQRQYSSESEHEDEHFSEPGSPIQQDNEYIAGYGPDQPGPSNPPPPPPRSPTPPPPSAPRPPPKKMGELNLNRPPNFDGSQKQAKAWWTTVSTYITVNKDVYDNHEKCIAFATSFMTKGHAQQWATGWINRKHDTATPMGKWDEFIKEF